MGEMRARSVTMLDDDANPLTFFSIRKKRILLIQQGIDSQTTSEHCAYRDVGERENGKGVVKPQQKK
jgi:hypothetical protein